MTLTPVEVRHLELRRGLFGYRRSHVHHTIDEIADSFEDVWRERSELGERIHELEAEVARHLELETLLRSTLVSAERAAQDMKEQARREADVIVAEAGAEGRRLVRDAIAEKEQLLAESRRVRTILRAALDVLAEGEKTEGAAEAEETEEAETRPEGVAPRLTEQPTGPAGVDRLAG
jgi:cell division initiation protein